MNKKAFDSHNWNFALLLNLKLNRWQFDTKTPIERIHTKWSCQKCHDWVVFLEFMHTQTLTTRATESDFKMIFPKRQRVKMVLLIDRRWIPCCWSFSPSLLHFYDTFRILGIAPSLLNKCMFHVLIETFALNSQSQFFWAWNLYNYDSAKTCNTDAVISIICCQFVLPFRMFCVHWMYKSKGNVHSILSHNLGLAVCVYYFVRCIIRCMVFFSLSAHVRVQNMLLIESNSFQLNAILFKAN